MYQRLFEKKAALHNLHVVDIIHTVERMCGQTYNQNTEPKFKT